MNEDMRRDWLIRMIYDAIDANNMERIEAMWAAMTFSLPDDIVDDITDSVSIAARSI